jgi:hypothetical protein
MRALSTIALRPDNDYWSDTAVLSSAADAPGEMLTLLLADPSATLSGRRMDFYERVAELAGRRNDPADLKQVLRTLTTVPALQETAATRHRLLFALGRGLKQAGFRLDSSGAPDKFGAKVTQLLDEFRMSAQRLALDPRSPEAERINAIEQLGCLTLERVHGPLSTALDAGQPAGVQLAAVRVLSEFSDPLAKVILLRHRP